jgi:hypothetical protein
MKSCVGSMVLLGACVVLSACATGYQKMNVWDGLGYTDEKVADGVYKLTYLVNANTPAQDALKYWHVRARELCGSDNYQHDEKQTIYVNRNAGVYGSTTYHNFPYVVGTVTCKSN